MILEQHRRDEEIRARGFDESSSESSDDEAPRAVREAVADDEAPQVADEALADEALQADDEALQADAPKVVPDRAAEHVAAFAEASASQDVPPDMVIGDGFAEAIRELAATGDVDAVLSALRSAQRTDLLWERDIFAAIAPAKRCARDAPGWFPGTQGQYVCVMKVRSGVQASARCPVTQALCEDWRGSAAAPSSSAAMLGLQQANTEEIMNHVTESLQPLYQAFLPQEGETHAENIRRHKANLNTAYTLMLQDREAKKQAKENEKEDRQKAREEAKRQREQAKQEQEEKREAKRQARHR